MGRMNESDGAGNPTTERAQTPVEVVALALDRYAELDEFQPLEGYVLKALSKAGYVVVPSGGDETAAHPRTDDATNSAVPFPARRAMQTAIWDECIRPGDNEWTTWTDSTILAECAARGLRYAGWQATPMDGVSASTPSEWFITDGWFKDGGKWIAGPFSTRADALTARTMLEKQTGGSYFVDALGGES